MYFVQFCIASSSAEDFFMCNNAILDLALAFEVNAFVIERDAFVVYRTSKLISFHERDFAKCFVIVFFIAFEHQPFI